MSNTPTTSGTPRGKESRSDSHFIRYWVWYMIGGVALVFYAYLVIALPFDGKWGMEYANSILIPIGAAVGAITVLWWGGWELKKQNEESKLLRTALQDQTRNSRKQVAVDMLKNAITHLAESNSTIVLGGIYTLNDLARSYEDKERPLESYSKIVSEIFCSFIRAETSKREYQVKHDNWIEREYQRGLTACKGANKTFDEIDDAEMKRVPSLIVIQTIINRLFRRPDPHHPDLYSQHHSKEGGGNLKSAFLRGIDLKEANFEGVHLHKAHLFWVNLRKANLLHANLHEADLRCARLHGADLRKAKLKEANLQGACLNGTIFSEDTVLEKAKMQGVNCNESSFSDYVGSLPPSYDVLPNFTGILYDAGDGYLQSEPPGGWQEWFITTKKADVTPMRWTEAQGLLDELKTVRSRDFATHDEEGRDH
ncbi:MAG: pentapeptide repeat-containing protein [Planctomycetaceae bacterium]|nr:pentapeptide repeat-containing protein [Planctomycetaceae bacterium]